MNAVLSVVRGHKADAEKHLPPAVNLPNPRASSGRVLARGRRPQDLASGPALSGEKAAGGAVLGKHGLYARWQWSLAGPDMGARHRCTGASVDLQASLCGKRRSLCNNCI